MAAPIKKINQNGQWEYTDKDGNAVTSTGLTQTTNSLESKKTKAEKKAEKAEKTKIFEENADEYYQDVYGMDRSTYDNLVMSSGSGGEAPQAKNGYISFDDWYKKKSTPVNNSKAPLTVPQTSALSPDVQQEVNTANEVTRQAENTIKDAADKGRDYIEKNNVQDKAEEVLKKYDMFANNINSHYEDGLPRSIMQAWKNGRFGSPDTKDAKSIRNNLIANELGTLASNIGSAFKNGETKEGLWTSSVRKNMEEADKRNNEKFETSMLNQLSQLDLAAKDQIELEKHINEIMADNTMSVAARHANNLEDTLGLWHMKQALGNEWNKLSTKQKQDFLNAVNAFNSGSQADIQALMTATLGADTSADISKKLLDYQVQQNKANADILTTDAGFKKFNNTVNAINGVLGVAGSAVGTAIKVATMGAGV